MDIPRHPLHWKRSWRIIPTLYPHKRLFDRIAPREDHDALAALEQRTNMRARQDNGDVNVLRPGDRFPPKASRYLVAPYAHRGMGRFTDGTFGAYYAANDLATAIAETRYHRVRFLSATREGPQLLRMLTLVADIRGHFHDIRKLRPQLPAVYASGDYAASQRLARALWKEHSAGIAYQSVRRAAGQCLAVYSPQCIRHLRQDRVLEYQWDGRDIAVVSAVKDVA